MYRSETKVVELVWGTRYVRITRPFKVRARPYTPEYAYLVLFNGKWAEANVITHYLEKKSANFLRELNYPLLVLHLQIFQIKKVHMNISGFLLRENYCSKFLRVLDFLHFAINRICDDVNLDNKRSSLMINLYMLKLFLRFTFFINLRS